jgi:hypothetical protein
MVYILALFYLGCFGYFSKNWAIFFQIIWSPWRYVSLVAYNDFKMEFLMLYLKLPVTNFIKLFTAVIYEYF